MMMRPFPRGNGPLLSVLLPSRGRPEHLAQAVDSIYSLAGDKNSVEFIFKADDDDIPTVNFLSRLERILPHKKIVSPRGHGYRDMHLWANSMSAMATGDWLLLFNDDARMLTNAWDDVLAHTVVGSVFHGVTDVACLVPSVSGALDDTAFFFLRRRVVEILGRFSYIPHNDTWIAGLMKMVHSMLISQHIQIDHFAKDPAKVINDSTYQEGASARETTAYTIHSRDATMMKLLDAVKLQHYIDCHPDKVVVEA